MSIGAFKKAEENNPHKRIHKVVHFLVALCLTVQVLEGSFIVPYILVHFGFPDLSIKEICDEMYMIVYRDERRECNYPYPLFAGPEVWKYPDMSDVVGTPAPPAPGYVGFGFRETVQRHKDRLARQRAEAEAKQPGSEP